jgi:hypothetical protein
MEKSISLSLSCPFWNVPTIWPRDIRGLAGHLSTSCHYHHITILLLFLFLFVVVPVFVFLFPMHNVYKSKLAMLCPTKHVKMVHERMKITEELRRI